MDGDKTIHSMGIDGIEAKVIKETTGGRITIPEIRIITKEIVKDITPGVGKPDKKVLEEWDSKDYKKRMKESWKPSNV